jgi:phage N-6-adenine-methyltransferase
VGAAYNRHKSEQAYRTPPDFFRAVQHKFVLPRFALDAAADKENTLAEAYYTEEVNGLVQPWVTWTWCNPPYADIEPWVKKAYNECHLGVSSMLLVPASVGANWWKHWVHNKAHAICLNGRITFVGQKDPYPKDLALLIYTPACSGGYSVWSWQDPL